VRLNDDLDPLDRGLRNQCEIFAELAGHLVASKLPYGDTLHQVRRTRPLDPAAELVMTMLPPQTFTCERLVVTATLEPAYSVGGDAYDYAVDADSAKVMILDAMGRGMYAAMTSAVALAAMRSARRDGHGLYSMARAADEVILGQFQDGRFVTGFLMDLDLGTGTLRYLNAGHWPAVILRQGKFVRLLDRGRRLPLGMDDPLIEIAEERLEPGDAVLLYTDGITEARDPDGEQFGLHRLTDLAERHAAEGLPAPEKLRRLSHSVIEHLGGPAHDDATLMLLEWSAVAARKTLSITSVRDGESR
jgi:serine phosphatase RsbU (regulator of sigma subunit)